MLICFSSSSRLSQSESSNPLSVSNFIRGKNFSRLPWLNRFSACRRAPVDAQEVVAESERLMGGL